MKVIIKERIVKDTVYKSIDGKEFDSKEACQEHENNYFSMYVSLLNDWGDMLDFSSTHELDNIYGIIFHKTDDEFVNDVLDYLEWFDDDTANKLSKEELHYKNKDNKIVLIYSDTYECWFNPAYRIKTYTDEATFITDMALK